MYFQIVEIILWPKNKNFKLRRVPLQLGKVNVISGASQSGKSAIIPIIDYCLGSGSCTIPVGVIRGSCEWYGVLIQTNEGQKLFARRDPGEAKSTGDMFFIEDIAIDTEKIAPHKTDDQASIKRRLDTLAGLTNLAMDGNSNNQFSGRPSFRDMAAFNFQPQGVVANPDILFYKSNASNHREKLKHIFPYLLNAITPEILIRQHELERVKKILQTKERELNSMRNVSERWKAELRSWAVQAREYGLVKTPIVEFPEYEGLIEMLREIVDYSGGDYDATSYEILDEVLEELNQIRREESKVSSELFRLRQRMDEMINLKDSISTYSDALKIQKDRLKVSEWVRSMHDSEHECALCGNNLNQSTVMIESLYNSLKKIEETAANVQTPPAAFDREYERVKVGIRVVEEQLKALKVRRTSLERSSESAKNDQYDSLSRSRFLGKLEQALQIYENIGSDGEMLYDIQELRNQIATLEKGISFSEIERKRKWALDKISSLAGKLLPNLDVERPDAPIQLVINDLTVKVSGKNRDDYLWEVGSGANWLSYHVAITLALHQFFISLGNSPVPSFIVYDQPSQVYFPKRVIPQKNISEVELDPHFTDEDTEAVHKVFNTFSSIVALSKGNLQIIVLDHADSSVWGELQNVHLVENEEWRKGHKLVPKEWIESD